MRRFVEGVDRGQTTLFPECPEDWIGEDNSVATAPRKKLRAQPLSLTTRMIILKSQEAPVSCR